MRNVVCYEIDEVCYYLTAGQDKMLGRLVKGENRERRIKKWAYCSGPKGEPIKDPEGTGAEAIVMPEGEELPATEEPSDPAEASADDAAREIEIPVAEDPAADISTGIPAPELSI